MAKAKSRAELQAELNVLRKWRRSDVLASVLNNLIRWGGAVAIVYFIYRSVETLAGQTTMASIGLRFFGDVRLNEVIAWILGGSGFLYGYSQRSFRRTKIHYMEGRIKELERATDPNRSSSGLTTRGETHPRDAI